MERDDIARLAAKAREDLATINAFDTPENETMLRSALELRGMRLTRGRKKSASRYTLYMQNGSSIEPVTLLDVHRLLEKWDAKKPR
jgi:hypothetical protein